MPIVVAPEVADALAAGGPVVALESTIISHGLPRPDNLRIAREIETTVREAGAVPATIALVSGVAHVGLDAAALAVIATSDDVAKASERDLAVLAAAGRHAATTVAATAHLAHEVGIELFATGGLGGVHRDAATTFDESADLVTLARTPVTVVSAGVKSILDVGATLERLETLGIAVVGYGTDRFPGFYRRDSGFAVDHRVDSPAEVAEVMATRRALGTHHAALLVANPLPEADEVPRALHDRVLAEGLAAADAAGVRGKDVTPFLLEHFHRTSEGESLRANITIILRNAVLAAQIAVAGGGALMPDPVVVVGDLMVDVVATTDAPLAHGSDTPARVTTGGGGSAANTASWLAATGTAVSLVAAVGDDAFGAVALAELAAAGVTFAGPTIAGTATGTCIVLVDATGERTMLPDRGANDALPVTAVAQVLQPPAGWLHLSGYTLLGEGSRAAGVAAIETARGAGLAWSVDAASAAPLGAVGPATFLAAARGASVLFANDDELAVLGGIEHLLALVAAVVVKHGAEGASWHTADATWSVPAEPATVVDTIGAGDAFDAGVIAAKVAGGLPEDCLRAGAALAARAVAHRGGRPG